MANRNEGTMELDVDIPTYLYMRLYVFIIAFMYS